MLEPPEGGGSVSVWAASWLCGAAGRGKVEGVTNSSQKWIFCTKTTLALGLWETGGRPFRVPTLSVSQSFRSALISS